MSSREISGEEKGDGRGERREGRGQGRGKGRGQGRGMEWKEMKGRGGSSKLTPSVLYNTLTRS